MLNETLISVGNYDLFIQAWPDLPIQAAQAFTQTWDAMQSELLGLSTRGSHLVTKESGHYIHYDEPALVVAAIHQMAQTICTHP